MNKIESLQKSLSSLRSYYEKNGRKPAPAKIAEFIGDAEISQTTVQRYLGKEDLKRPSYSKILAIGNALGMNTDDLSLDEDALRDMDNEQLQSTVVQISKHSVEMLSSNDQNWRERLEELDKKHAEEIRHLTDAHNEEIRNLAKANADEKKRVNEEHNAHVARLQEMHNDQILTVHESYKVQMQQMREANANNIAQMLDAHQQQVEHIQKTNDTQLKALQDISQTQKEADEKSKAYLKSLVRFWRVFSIALLAALILLLVADVLNPSRGWLQFISGRINLSYHPFA